MVLETFKVKEAQLDAVVECARTWRFDGSGDSLVWDGQVVEKRWSQGVAGLRLPKNASWYDRCKAYEVRIVRFVRKRVG